MTWDSGDDTRYRKGLEALALALYRQKHKRSPTVNFGRILRGYRLSSHNNAKLVVAAKRLRGGPSTIEQDNWTDGVAPLSSLEGDPQDARWCGHQWSDWLRLQDAAVQLASGAVGLYRMRERKLPGLVYVGEGYISARLANHLGKARKAAHRQGPFFRSGLECAWTINTAWLRHQRVELETDLIGAHVLSTGHAPAAQLLG